MSDDAEDQDGTASEGEAPDAPPAEAADAVEGTPAGEAPAEGDAPAADAATLPLVFATMHFAYGFGLFAGARRYGAPAAAVAGALRRAAKLAPTSPEGLFPHET